MVTQLTSDIAIFNGSDIADIAYYLCKLHGHHPGIFDYLAENMRDSEHHGLVTDLAAQFAVERAVLANMTVAAGPATTLAGEYTSIKVIEQLRSAINMLGQSERNGSSLGSGIAIVSDWLLWRPAFDAISARLDIEIPECTMLNAYQQLADLLSQKTDPRELRAVSFGMEQLYHQHDQFWLLMERRQKLRNAMLGKA